MQTLSYYLKHPKVVGNIVLYYFCRWMPDKMYLKIKFRLWMGYPLDLKHPKTFAEKLQWLKLYDRKTIYHQMVDKVVSKSLIHGIVGKGHTIPTLGVYDSFEQIDWEALPNQFILKATHDSGSYYIVKDKNTIDKKKCKKQLYIHWNQDYYISSREWQYKGLKSRIIAEPLIAEPKQLREYKFFCFNGEPLLYQTCYDRDNSLGGAILNFYDINGDLLDLHDKGHCRISDIKTPKPLNLELMIEYSRLLSKDMCFLRVDFYEVDNQFFVGELTLHENAGFCSFKPDQWNRTLGDWIKLPVDEDSLNEGEIK